MFQHMICVKLCLPLPASHLYKTTRSHLVCSTSRFFFLGLCWCNYIWFFQQLLAIHGKEAVQNPQIKIPVVFLLCDHWSIRSRAVQFGTRSSSHFILHRQKKSLRILIFDSPCPWKLHQTTIRKRCAAFCFPPSVSVSLLLEKGARVLHLGARWPHRRWEPTRPS